VVDKPHYGVDELTPTPTFGASIQTVYAHFRKADSELLQVQVVVVGLGHTIPIPRKVGVGIHEAAAAVERQNDMTTKMIKLEEEDKRVVLNTSTEAVEVVVDMQDKTIGSLNSKYQHTYKIA